MNNGAIKEPATLVVIDDTDYFWAVLYYTNKLGINTVGIVAAGWVDDIDIEDAIQWIRNTGHFFGYQTVVRELLNPFEEHEDGGYCIKSPETDKVYVGGNESEALELMIQEEPYALLRMAEPAELDEV